MDANMLFVILKGISSLFTFVQNTANEDALTPEFLDARDAVRAALVEAANNL